MEGRNYKTVVDPTNDKKSCFKFCINYFKVCTVVYVGKCRANTLILMTYALKTNVIQSNQVLTN